MNPLTKIKISGYRSIKNLKLELSDINILVGCNGAGKSNLLSFFEMLLAMKNYSLRQYVVRQGGANILLYNGHKETKSINFSLHFQNCRFEADMETRSGDPLYFSRQTLYRENQKEIYHTSVSVEELRENEGIQKEGVLDEIGVYHFHDTSMASPIKNICQINDNIELAADGHNIAAILYRIKVTNGSAYDRIIKTIRLTAPYFQDFILRPNPFNPQTIRLEWKKWGCDIPFNADQFSDGSLRFICLVVLLCLPSELRKPIIFIDEPELGLHPLALTLISELMKKYSMHGQVISATQSVGLIDEFQAKDVIIVENNDGASTFHHLKEEELHYWLEDYSLGELWEKMFWEGDHK